MPRVATKPCGTVAAARRHQRNPEKWGPLDGCADCRQALRDDKNSRAQEKREMAAAAARVTAKAVGGLPSRRAMLEEVLVTLRGHLHEALPQSVAAIAKQIRDTMVELEQLDGAASVSSSVVVSGGGENDLDARRARRAARRGAAAQD